MPEDRARRIRDGLDRALDKALAELTASPALTDLRRRVMERLDQQSARPRAEGRARPVGWALAAAAGVALVAALWLRTGVRPSPAPRQAVVTPALPQPDEPSVHRSARPAVPERMPRPTPRVAAAQARPSRRLPAVPAVLPDDDMRLATLPLPTPLDPGQLTLSPADEPSALDIPGLRVEPLADWPAGDASPSLGS